MHCLSSQGLLLAWLGLARDRYGIVGGARGEGIRELVVLLDLVRRLPCLERNRFVHVRARLATAAVSLGNDKNSSDTQLAFFQGSYRVCKSMKKSLATVEKVWSKCFCEKYGKNLVKHFFRPLVRKKKIIFHTLYLLIYITKIFCCVTLDKTHSFTFIVPTVI